MRLFDATALVFDLLRNLRDAACGRALEQHVFQHVRQTCAHPTAFRDAARAAPTLRAHNEGALVFLDEESQSVLEDCFAHR